MANMKSQHYSLTQVIRLSRCALVSALCFGLLALACQSREHAVRLDSGIIHKQDGDFLARARILHERIISIDSHSFFPTGSCGATDFKVDLPKMKAGGLDCAFYVVFVKQQQRTGSMYDEAKRQALEAFQGIHSTVQRCGSEISLALAPEDLQRLKANGKLAVAIGIENGFALGRDLSLLKTYQSMGAAYIGLTHAGHNDIADSATPSDELGDLPSEHEGISEFGEQVIAEMNRLGIIIDVSHMSKDATLDAIRLSRAPVVASHSSIHTIVPNARNMDDETLLAVAAKGGVIQITAVHSFLKVDPPGSMEAFSRLLEEFNLETDGDAKMLPPQRRAEFESRLANLGKHWALASVAHMVDHIDYAVGLVGVDHVGIGSDFEGGGGVTGWADASETLNVTAEMLRRGYSDDEIRKIWGGNFLRVWQEVRKLSGQK